MIEKYPALRSIDTAFVVDTDRNRNERVAWRSLCAVRLGEYMGWPEKLLFLPFSIIPRTVGDWIYDFVAKNRNKWFGRHEMCPIPPPEIRERFISL
jgi:predicted DCC family thiol-disulfide oxidoreductase YuxK